MRGQGDSHEARTTLPSIAGGAPEPGERLAEAIPFMPPQEAATASRWVETWRHMSRRDFDDAASRL